jgi:hypothetical protein
MDVTSSGDQDEGIHWSHVNTTRVFRVEHRGIGTETIVLARIRNVFAHHDTLTQFVSRLLNECGTGSLAGELVLVDDATEAVLARRDLRRAGYDARRNRQKLTQARADE